MKFNELEKRLIKLKEAGYLKSLRRGPTGIGHLVETVLGISETNLAIPDIGGRIEIKATRRNINSLITLFTFNRGVWKLKQSEIINKFGYLDIDGRKALYTTVNTSSPNSQGFYIQVDKEKNIIVLKNSIQDEPIAEWSTYVITGKFMTKLDRLLLIFAETKIEDGLENFWFNEAYLLEKPTPEKFINAFLNNEILVDIRMHIKDSGGVRNHGTGFRISEKNLIHLYDKIRKII
ncbi:MAG: MvaI/BcnI family restriction endonuclease [Ignavibacterium sp.]